MFINHTHFSIRLFQLFAIIEKLTHLGSFTSQGSREFEKEKFRVKEGRKRREPIAKKTLMLSQISAVMLLVMWQLAH